MLYFKKSELAESYHISNKTVANWIKEVKEGRLDFELHNEGEKSWILKTTRNIALIEQLVKDRRKFRNARGVKTIAPKARFYEEYNEEQILDITSSLDIYHEIPFQYGYFNEGANFWDAYVKRLASENVPNFLTATVDLLEANRGYIELLVGRYKRVNVIDVGAGNSLPVKNFLDYLRKKNQLGRYIALDISASMLEIAERNVRNWFGDTVPFEGYEIDINHDRFSNKLIDEIVGEQGSETVNLVFVLGGTLVNLREPDGAFRTIHDSMNKNDLMIYTLKLDSEVTRQYFDFSIDEKKPLLDAKAKRIVDLLGIDETFYEVEVGFDVQRRERYMRIRLNVALTLNFSFEHGERTIEFNKSDTILLWRYSHQNMNDSVSQLEASGFGIMQISLTEDADYLLAIARIRTEKSDLYNTVAK
jgi:uncharacterized SAM-dependent methyltransferase